MVERRREQAAEVVERCWEPAADTYRDIGGRAVSGTSGREKSWMDLFRASYLLASRSLQIAARPGASLCALGKLNAKRLRLARYVILLRYTQRLSAFTDELLFSLFQAVLDIIAKARAVAAE